MRPWESLSRRDGGQPAQRAGRPAQPGGGGGRRHRTGSASALEGKRPGPGQGSGKALTRRVRLRRRELKRPAILRVSGSFGFQLPLGFVRIPDAPAATTPRLDAGWEFYPIYADVATAMVKTMRSFPRFPQVLGVDKIVAAPLIWTQYMDRQAAESYNVLERCVVRSFGGAVYGRAGGACSRTRSGT
jgi:hypothetical protein